MSNKLSQVKLENQGSHRSLQLRKGEKHIFTQYAQPTVRLQPGGKATSCRIQQNIGLSIA